MKKGKRSISVEFWSRVFYILRFISTFWLIRNLIKNKSSHWWQDFIDLWVLGNLFLAFISLFIVKYSDNNFLQYFIIYYGFLRVFEIIVYQINVLLFDEYRTQKSGKVYKLRGYRRMIVNLFNNFGEIMFWFASSYAVYYSSVADAPLPISKLIFSSFSTMTTFGVSNLHVKDEMGLFILWFQSVAGLLMTIISISRFIGLLPRVDSLDELEN